MGDLSKDIKYNVMINDRLLNFGCNINNDRHIQHNAGKKDKSDKKDTQNFSINILNSSFSSSNLANVDKKPKNKNSKNKDENKTLLNDQHSEQNESYETVYQMKKKLLIITGFLDFFKEKMKHLKNLNYISDFIKEEDVEYLLTSSAVFAPIMLEAVSPFCFCSFSSVSDSLLSQSLSSCSSFSFCAEESKMLSSNSLFSQQVDSSFHDCLSHFDSLSFSSSLPFFFILMLKRWRSSTKKYTIYKRRKEEKKKNNKIKQKFFRLRRGLFSSFFLSPLLCREKTNAASLVKVKKDNFFLLLKSYHSTDCCHTSSNFYYNTSSVPSVSPSSFSSSFSSSSQVYFSTVFSTSVSSCDVCCSDSAFCLQSPSSAFPLIHSFSPSLFPKISIRFNSENVKDYVVEEKELNEIKGRRLENKEETEKEQKQQKGQEEERKEFKNLKKESNELKVEVEKNEKSEESFIGKTMLSYIFNNTSDSIIAKKIKDMDNFKQNKIIECLSFSTQFFKGKEAEERAERREKENKPKEEELEKFIERKNEISQIKKSHTINFSYKKKKKADLLKHNNSTTTELQENVSKKQMKGIKAKINFFKNFNEVKDKEEKKSKEEELVNDIKHYCINDNVNITKDANKNILNGKHAFRLKENTRKFCKEKQEQKLKEGKENLSFYGWMLFFNYENEKKNVQNLRKLDKLIFPLNDSFNDVNDHNISKHEDKRKLFFLRNLKGEEDLLLNDLFRELYVFKRIEGRELYELYFIMNVDTQHVEILNDGNVCMKMFFYNIFNNELLSLSRYKLTKNSYVKNFKIQCKKSFFLSIKFPTKRHSTLWKNILKTTVRNCENLQTKMKKYYEISEKICAKHFEEFYLKKFDCFVSARLLSYLRNMIKKHDDFHHDFFLSNTVLLSCFEQHHDLFITTEEETSQEEYTCSFNFKNFENYFFSNKYDYYYQKKLIFFILFEFFLQNLLRISVNCLPLQTIIETCKSFMDECEFVFHNLVLQIGLPFHTTFHYYCCNVIDQVLAILSAFWMERNVLLSVSDVLSLIHLLYTQKKRMSSYRAVHPSLNYNINVLVFYYTYRLADKLKTLTHKFLMSNLNIPMKINVDEYEFWLFDENAVEVFRFLAHMIESTRSEKISRIKMYTISLFKTVIKTLVKFMNEYLLRKKIWTTSFAVFLHKHVYSKMETSGLAHVYDFVEESSKKQNSRDNENNREQEIGFTLNDRNEAAYVGSEKHTITRDARKTVFCEESNDIVNYTTCDLKRIDFIGVSYAVCVSNCKPPSCLFKLVSKDLNNCFVHRNTFCEEGWNNQQIHLEKTEDNFFYVIRSTELDYLASQCNSINIYLLNCYEMQDYVHSYFFHKPEKKINPNTIQQKDHCENEDNSYTFHFPLKNNEINMLFNHKEIHQKSSFHTKSKENFGSKHPTQKLKHENKGKKTKKNYNKKFCFEEEIQQLKFFQRKLFHFLALRACQSVTNYIDNKQSLLLVRISEMSLLLYSERGGILFCLKYRLQKSCMEEVCIKILKNIIQTYLRKLLTGCKMFWMSKKVYVEELCRHIVDTERYLKSLFSNFIPLPICIYLINFLPTIHSLLSMSPFQIPLYLSKYRRMHGNAFSVDLLRRSLLLRFDMHRHEIEETVSCLVELIQKFNLRKSSKDIFKDLQKSFIFTVDEKNCGSFSKAISNHEELESLEKDKYALSLSVEENDNFWSEDEKSDATIKEVHLIDKSEMRKQYGVKELWMNSWKNKGSEVLENENKGILKNLCENKLLHKLLKGDSILDNNMVECCEDKFISEIAEHDKDKKEFINKEYLSNIQMNNKKEKNKNTSFVFCNKHSDRNLNKKNKRSKLKEELRCKSIDNIFSNRIIDAKVEEEEEDVNIGIDQEEDEFSFTELNNLYNVFQSLVENVEYNKTICEGCIWKLGQWPLGVSHVLFVRQRKNEKLNDFVSLYKEEQSLSAKQINKFNSGTEKGNDYNCNATDTFYRRYFRLKFNVLECFSSCFCMTPEAIIPIKCIKKVCVINSARHMFSSTFSYCKHNKALKSSGRSKFTSSSDTLLENENELCATNGWINADLWGWSFQIVLKNGYGENITLQCVSPESRDKWISCLNIILLKHKKEKAHLTKNVKCIYIENNFYLCHKLVKLKTLSYINSINNRKTKKVKHCKKSTTKNTCRTDETLHRGTFVEKNQKEKFLQKDDINSFNEILKSITVSYVSNSSLDAKMHQEVSFQNTKNATWNKINYCINYIRNSTETQDRTNDINSNKSLESYLLSVFDFIDVSANKYLANSLTLYFLDFIVEPDFYSICTMVVHFAQDLLYDYFDLKIDAEAEIAQNLGYNYKTKDFMLLKTLLIIAFPTIYSFEYIAHRHLSLCYITSLIHKKSYAMSFCETKNYLLKYVGLSNSCCQCGRPFFFFFF